MIEIDFHFIFNSIFLFISFVLLLWPLNTLYLNKIVFPNVKNMQNEYMHSNLLQTKYVAKPQSHNVHKHNAFEPLKHMKDRFLKSSLQSDFICVILYKVTWREFFYFILFYNNHNKMKTFIHTLWATTL